MAIPSTEREWAVLEAMFADEAHQAIMLHEPDLPGWEQEIAGVWHQDEGRTVAGSVMDVWAAIEDAETTAPAGPGERIPADLRLAEEALTRSAAPVHETVQLQEPVLAEAIATLGRIRRAHEAATFTFAREAHERGLHTESGLSFVDWLRHAVPGLSGPDAAQHGSVVAYAVTPAGQVLGEAMLEGRVPLHRAALVARTLRRLHGSLTPEQRERYGDIATSAACRSDLPDRDLALVCRRLIEDLLDEAAPGERERAAHELRSVSSRRLGNGLTRFTVDAPDLHTAVLAGVLSSALAAPQPTEEGPDLRMAGQRRFDALMAVVERGISNPGAPPSTARASVILTIPFDTERGEPAGPGRTPTGELVSRRQASQLACNGEITPVWLGPAGEPLFLGETARYATPGQWKALVARDQHCTFPGCSRPPQWCDSHHLVWWSRGGLTDIDQLVLLCGQHHTIVHQKDLTAQVVGGTVVWHV